MSSGSFTTQAGIYVETWFKPTLRVTQAGIYIEWDVDASPILVTTDGEQSPIFGVFN